MKDLLTRGVFWMAIMCATMYMLTMMANGHFSWYHYVFIMISLPGLLIIISCIILIRPDSLSGHDLIDLLKHISKVIYGSILAFVNKRNREVD